LAASGWPFLMSYVYSRWFALIPDKCSVSALIRDGSRSIVQHDLRQSLPLA
jgi:hypothetical protein